MYNIALYNNTIKYNIMKKNKAPKKENEVFVREILEDNDGKAQSFSRIAEKLVDGLFDYCQMSAEELVKNRKSYYRDLEDLQNVLEEINKNLK